MTVKYDKLWILLIKNKMKKGQSGPSVALYHDPAEQQPPRLHGRHAPPVQGFPLRHRRSDGSGGG